MAKVEEIKEEYLLVTKSIDKAVKLRTELMSNFYRMWVCILKHGDEYKMSAMSNWGGSLPIDEQVKVKEFVKEFVKKEPPEVVTTGN